VVGNSSTGREENTQVLQGRRGFAEAEELNPFPVTLFLELQVLADGQLLGD
jgi:hypothetical protein